MASSNLTTSTIGFPRIGPNREMKKALERSVPSLILGSAYCACRTSFAFFGPATHCVALIVQLLEEAAESGGPSEGQRPDREGRMAASGQGW